MMKNGFCKFEDNSCFRTITFFHPAHNSLPSDILSELAQVILSTKDNPDISCIILKSHGERTFCAGASFNELISIENMEDGKSFFMGFANVINAIRKCNKLVITIIQGKAVGGGVGIAAASDYVIATKWASIRLSELAVGIGPFVIGPAVERKIGLAKFSKMSLCPNQWQSAQWALESGLYSEVFDDLDGVNTYLETFKAELSSYNKDALSQLKTVFWEGTEDWDLLLEKRAKISGKLVLSDASKKSIQTFLKK